MKGESHNYIDPLPQPNFPRLDMAWWNTARWSAFRYKGTTVDVKGRDMHRVYEQQMLEQSLYPNVRITVETDGY